MARAGPERTRLGHVSVPDGKPALAVLVLHSWWGMTPSFTTYADALAERGFLVGCADLYGGETAASPDEVQRLRAARRAEPMHRTLTHGIDELAAGGPGAPAPGAALPVAVVGFSMGGHWACWLTQHLERPLAAVVLYYAARAGDFTTTSTAITAHFADDDDHVSADARRRMERAIAQSTRRYTSHDYPGTRHWFAEPTEEAHDPASAALAFERTVAALKADGTPAPSGT